MIPFYFVAVALVAMGGIFFAKRKKRIEPFKKFASDSYEIARCREYER